MGNVNFHVDFSSGLSRYARVLQRIHDKTMDLEPVMGDAANYMVRATVNRILRTKKAPSGDRWAALAEATIASKGHDSILFETGELYKSIQVSDVSNSGFVVSAEAKHAWPQQFGFKNRRTKKSVPARPFLGFSEENEKRISKMIRDYIAGEI